MATPKILCSRRLLNGHCRGNKLSQRNHVAVLAGRSNLNTTGKYVRLSLRDRAMAVDKLAVGVIRTVWLVVEVVSSPA